MTIQEYRFHIYAKEKCLFNNLKKEEFENKWETLRGMVGLMKLNIRKRTFHMRRSRLSKIP